MRDEKELEDKFCQYAESKGCRALKLVLRSIRGFPDRTVICPGGRVFFVEFKFAWGKTTPQQDLWCGILRGFGFEVHVCRDLEEGQEILDLFLEGLP